MPNRYFLAALVAVVVTALALVWSFNADAAAPQCMPTASGLAQAQAKYGEVPAFTGMSDIGAELVITVNPDTHTWTFWLKPSPDTICPLAGGQAWKATEKAAPPDPVPQMWRGLNGTLLIPIAR